MTNRKVWCIYVQEPMTGNPAKEGLMYAIQRAYVNKWRFLATFVAVFFVSFSALAAFDMVPEKKEDTKVATKPSVTTPAQKLPEELPSRIDIPAVGISVKVLNPTATDVASLDAALLSGAVRYPGSAKLGEEGNTVLFGHSSYLPVVHNQSYKAFNKIQDLEKGDRITVYGNGHTYVYAVDKVYQANATTDAIPLTVTGHTLTLVTCDSFASKSDRFVVTATLVESSATAS